ncbi:hypothetical protein F1C12_20340 [Leifsonia shinshuensis]|uniref:Uncharacterized protein n=1 Tax=Leifsonia shinshuensis TaxID=150026 RepID=A0A7G6YH83_9MICO|nr:hypothetical protein F1C12_20340 [Leifsonia shinshuensis]
MNHQSTREDANRAYFQALANSRGSLRQLAALSILNIVLLGILSYFFNPPGGVRGHEALWFFRDVNLVLIGLSVVVLILSVFRSLLFRFQAMFSIVMAFGALVMVYSVCLLTLPMVTFIDSNEDEYRAEVFIVSCVVASAIVVSATAVHVIRLRRRLRAGHSEKRTIGNYLAVSKSRRSKILWITFGVIAVVPNLLTSGQYLTNALGAIGLIFFACVLPSLPVEFSYLAYLKLKDRVYWEVRPPRMPAQERRRLTRKVVLWLVGIVVAIAAFWVLAKYLRF